MVELGRGHHGFAWKLGRVDEPLLREKWVECEVVGPKLVLEVCEVGE